MSADTNKPDVIHALDWKHRRHERAESVRAELASKATAMEAVADRYARFAALDGALSADEREMIERDISRHRGNAANLREAMTWPD
jgi:hypothetical protein